MRIKNAVGWLPPIQSEFGWHLVLVDERISSRQLALDDVQAQVREKWITEEAKRRAQASLQILVDSYDVNIEL